MPVFHVTYYLVNGEFIQHTVESHSKEDVQSSVEHKIASVANKIIVVGNGGYITIDKEGLDRYEISEAENLSVQIA